MKLLWYFLLIFLVLLNACSSSEQSAKKEQIRKPEVYIFDDVSKADSIKADTLKMENAKSSQLVKEPLSENSKNEPEAISTTVEKFVVQVGAFTTRERAQAFIKENQVKIQQQMELSYNGKVKLYVVQLPPFSKREDAEKIKHNLQQIQVFKDAFVIISQ